MHSGVFLKSVLPFKKGPEGGVYVFLTSGGISRDHPSLTRNGIDLPSDQDLLNPFKFSSAYAHHPKGEPEFTNYTSDFIGTLDYIFFSKAELETSSLLDLPEKKDLEKFLPVGCPNEVYGSDHLALFSEFIYKSPIKESFLEKDEEGQTSKEEKNQLNLEENKKLAQKSFDENSDECSDVNGSTINLIIEPENNSGLNISKTFEVLKERTLSQDLLNRSYDEWDNSNNESEPLRRSTSLDDLLGKKSSLLDNE